MYKTYTFWCRLGMAGAAARLTNMLSFLLCEDPADAVGVVLYLVGCGRSISIGNQGAPTPPPHRKPAHHLTIPPWVSGLVCVSLQPSGRRRADVSDPTCPTTCPHLYRAV